MSIWDRSKLAIKTEFETGRQFFESRKAMGGPWDLITTVLLDSQVRLCLPMFGSRKAKIPKYQILKLTWGSLRRWLELKHGGKKREIMWTVPFSPPVQPKPLLCNCPVEENATEHPIPTASRKRQLMRGKKKKKKGSWLPCRSFIILS